MSASSNISNAFSSSGEVRRLLEGDPNVCSVGISESHILQFSIEEWHREVTVGDASLSEFGLVETIDNNPLVCADAVSVPNAESTLALIALTPLIQAGLLVEPPALIYSFAVDEASIHAALTRCGLSGECAVHVEPVEAGTVLAATVMAAVHTPDDLEDIDRLYDDAFGRSFFVRRDEESEWTPELVQSRPFAVYRLRISPDQPHSLLTIRLMADPEGKCGAAQIVHAMNVMCGFEESLGIA